MTEAKTKLARYNDVRHLIRDGDLLLFRQPGIIATMGRGIHNHAAKAAWWGDDLFILEMMQFIGGRAVTLSSQVEGWPEQWDVYETNPDQHRIEYNRDGSTRFMKRLCGAEYGYFNLARAALLHMPLVRCFVKPDTYDTAASNRRPAFCSQACALADRLGGNVDPVPNLADRITEPADLARSSFYRYRFTLIP
ncbi:MAG: hypothetical protein GY832_01500 [Chloroflexi bacterium]|nr:hypothetical protein [Chloroflexota bacterium]